MYHCNETKQKNEHAEERNRRSILSVFLSLFVAVSASASNTLNEESSDD